MDSRLNNLVYKSKNIVPYTAKILKADDFVTSDMLISNNGLNVHGNNRNIAFFADTSVEIGGTGPILQLYGKGSEGASVGINFDTFESDIFNFSFYYF